MKRTILFAFMVISLLVLFGCTKKEESSICYKPYFEYIKGQCCLDSNNDKICDNDETQEEKIVEEKKEPSKEIDSQKQFYCGDGNCDASEGYSSCPKDCGQRSILLVIDPAFYGYPIDGKIDKIPRDDRISIFGDDLKSEGYNVLYDIRYSTKGITPQDVRRDIKKFYTEQLSTGAPLVGVFLIGDIPYVYYNKEGVTMPTMQYYMDLDGVFGKSSQNCCTYSLVKDSQCEDSSCFDTHKGDTKSEIWVSVLPAVSNPEETIININQYLDKNHNYRIGLNRPSKGFLEILLGSKLDTQEAWNAQLQYIKEGFWYSTYSPDVWIALTHRGKFDMFADNSIGKPNAKIGYESALLSDEYDLANIGAHGSGTSILALEGGSTVITTEWVKSQNIRPIFIIDGSCNNGNIDFREENIGIGILYGSNTALLIMAKTSTYEGLRGESTIAQNLVEGKSFGEAVLDRHKKDAVNRGNDFYSTLFLGDLTLKLQEHMK